MTLDEVAAQGAGQTHSVMCYSDLLRRWGVCPCGAPRMPWQYGRRRPGSVCRAGAGTATHAAMTSCLQFPVINTYRAPTLGAIGNDQPWGWVYAAGGRVMTVRACCRRDTAVRHENQERSEMVGSNRKQNLAGQTTFSGENRTVTKPPCTERNPIGRAIWARPRLREAGFGTK